MTEGSSDKKLEKKRRSWLRRFLYALGREPKNRKQLVEMISRAADREILSTEMLGMVQRIFQVSEMHVRDVMVPKGNMVVIQNNATLKEILPILIESAHSRFPVVDPSGKDVVGILLAKDLLQFYFEGKAQHFNLKEIIRPAVFTPQSKRLDTLLREFRSKRNHIAIVLDEYGHVEGLVTIEDVLEQIVGEIEDEYDIEEEGSRIKKLDEEIYIVKAATLIEEFNEYFNSDFSDKEFDTIGGIVLQKFGHLPQRGETIKLDKFRFKVLHSDNRRIYLLEVKVHKPKKSHKET